MSERTWAITVNYLAKRWHSHSMRITSNAPHVAAARAMREVKKLLPKGRRIIEFSVKGTALTPLPIAPDAEIRA